MTGKRGENSEKAGYPIFGTLAWRSDQDGCTYLVAQDGVPDGLRVAVRQGTDDVTDITDEVTKMASPALGEVVPAWLVRGPCAVIVTLGDRVVTAEASSP